MIKISSATTTTANRSTTTMIVLFSLLLPLVGAEVVGATPVEVVDSVYKVPLFHPHELLLSSSSTSSKLYETLSTTGLLAISLPEGGAATEGGEEDARTTALQGFCFCEKDLVSHDNDKSHSSTNPKLVDSILLGDGQTTRTTLATATVGTKTPLPFESSDELSRLCTPSTLEAMESLRDQVAEVSKLFVQALDNILSTTTSTSSSTPAPAARPLMRNSYGGTYPTISSIVEASTNLEHFHVYSKTTTTNSHETDNKAALQLHTDAGLFLAFVPAYNCDLQEARVPDQSFYLRNARGQIQKAIFPSNSIAIMLGMGAEQWLQSRTTTSSAAGIRLKATRHSVQMVSTEGGGSSPSSIRRAWYGMMHLVPESAIIEEYPRPKTFGQMKQQAQNNNKNKNHDDDDNDVSIGCGFSDYNDNNEELEDNLLPLKPQRRRRRLQHVENAGACNNRTNFYCWMSCLDIPHQDQAASYINEGYSLYCVDPSIVASSGGKVSQAQEPCTQRSVVGLAMNSNCMGMWLPTVPEITGWDGVYAQPVVTESPAAVSPNNIHHVSDGGTISLEADQEEPWCYGGTSMYMDGFQWLGTTCAIYLFPTFVLSTAGSLVGACFATIIFGIALEWIIQQRRITTRKFGPGYKRLMVGATFYGIQLTMGYTIMLIVMIYSIPLFLAVIVGIVSGHILFSAPDAIFRKRDTTLGMSGRSGGGGTFPGRGVVGMDDGTKLSDQGQNQGCANCEGGCDGGELFLQEQADSATNASTSSLTTSVIRRKKASPEAPLPSQVQDLEIPEGSTPCCQNEL